MNCHAIGGYLVISLEGGGLTFIRQPYLVNIQVLHLNKLIFFLTVLVAKSV